MKIPGLEDRSCGNGEKVVNSVNKDRARGKSGLHAGNDEQSAFFVWRGRLVKRSSIG